MRYVPAVIGWIMVAAVVTVAITSAPHRTNAVDVVLADPPRHAPSRIVAATTTTPPPVAPTTGTTTRTTTSPPTTTTPTLTTTSTSTPTTTTTTTSTTTTELPACSAPDLSGPVTATFQQPCSGAQVLKWPTVRIDVPAVPDTGGVGIVVHTLTDEFGGPSEDHHFVAGLVSEPGLWEGNVQVGVLCQGARTRAELQVYEFTATGWAYFTGPRESWQEIFIPSDSKLLDLVTVTRTDEPPGSDCENP